MWVVNEQLRHNECPIVDVWLVDIVPLYCFSRFLLLLYDNLLDVFNIEPCIFIKISWNLVSQMVHINMAFLQTIQCQNIVETFPLIHQIVHFKNHQIVHFRNYYIHNQWCIKASLNLTYFLWRKITCAIEVKSYVLIETHILIKITINKGTSVTFRFFFLIFSSPNLIMYSQYVLFFIDSMML